MNLILRRKLEQPDQTCTLGIMMVGDVTLHTIERPWIPSLTGKGGTKGVSCVPKGLYRLVKHNTEAHPVTWALVNPDLDVQHYPSAGIGPNVRTAVLIHSANFVYELRGCIAPGMGVAHNAPNSSGGYSVTESRQAMRVLREHMPWTDGHSLEIV